MSFQRYDVETDAWNVLANLAGLAAAIGTSLSLVHACDVLGVGGTAAVFDDDSIICNGDAGVFTGAGVSNLIRYSIAGNAWNLLTGAGGARGGAPAVGSDSVWLPNNPDVLFSLRGGGSPILDVYTGATDAWAAFTPLPGKNHGEGVCSVAFFRYPNRICYFDADGEIIVIDCTPVGAAAAAPVVDCIHHVFAGSAAAHEGQMIIAWQRSDRLYVGAVPHGTLQTQRIEVPLP
jgi:hypothetical protein